jgi:hypothetical protein
MNPFSYLGDLFRDFLICSTGTWIGSCSDDTAVETETIDSES